MEKFVLDEVDYALHHGYSRRAKRHMVRNLHKELEKHFQLTYNDFKYDNVPICITITYISISIMLYYIMSVNNFGPPIKMLN